MSGFLRRRTLAAVLLVVGSHSAWSPGELEAYARAQPVRGAALAVVVESVGPDGVDLRWRVADGSGVGSDKTESSERTEDNERAEDRDAAAGTRRFDATSEVELRVWFGDVDPDETCSVAERPSMLGEVETQPGRLAFRPRLPLRRDQVYTACLTLADGEVRSAPMWWSGRFSFGDGTPSEAARSTLEAPRVVSVWPPPGQSIPANALRFYLEFDQPMRAASVDRAVQLVDPQGRAIHDAFVPIPEGLWDSARRRLTMTLHPGRIKQGVGPREVQGPVLAEGGVVRLEVGALLRSAAGHATAPAGFEYRVGPEDRVAPDPGAWRLVPPSAAGEPLRLELDERLDPAILRRAVRLVEIRQPVAAARAVGPRVEVDLDVDGAGRRLSVRPKGGEWAAGVYRLDVLGIVEDLAGNRPGRAFDASLLAGGPVGGAQRDPEWFSFEFEVPAADGSGGAVR